MRVDEAGERQPSDDEKLASYAAGLADALSEHLPAWAVGVVDERAPAGHGVDLASLLAGPVERVIARVRSLLAEDIDQQRTNPLAVVRSIVPDLTRVLADAGAIPPARDDESARLQPDDLFSLAPATFGDIHPDVHMPGIAWGAAKAHVHLQRRSAEGMR